MINYARAIGKDRNDQPIIPSHIPQPANASTTRENASASSVTSLSDLTSAIEVTAVTTAAGLKWATSQATSVITAQGSANFDNIVPANTTRLFIVPRRVQAVPSISGINTQEGLYNNVATISTGVGSVLLAEF